MIVNNGKIDTKVFTSEFEKRFRNFCSKSPLFLHNPIITDKGVALYHYVGDDYKKKKLFDFDFDFTKDVKSNIYDIRTKLVNKHYPIMIQRIEYEQKYSVEDLNFMVSNGDIAFDQITPEGGIMEEKKVKWRIEKVIIEGDELHVRNLDTMKIKRFRLKIPCTFFLKKIITEITDQHDRWNYFENKSKLISDGYEVDKEGNRIERGEEIESY